tara:strand:- start:3845 stop:3991 length:147 start_codon:yes stop_codon:yes gene_type:complete
LEALKCKLEIFKIVFIIAGILMLCSPLFYSTGSLAQGKELSERAKANE